MSNKYTALKITPDGTIISCTKEIQCWKTGQCQLPGGLGKYKCLVQQADNFRIYLDGRITPNNQTLWRRLYPKAEPQLKPCFKCRDCIGGKCQYWPPVDNEFVNRVVKPDDEENGED